MSTDSADAAHQYQGQEVSLACCLLFPEETWQHPEDPTLSASMRPLLPNGHGIPWCLLAVAGTCDA